MKHQYCYVASFESEDWCTLVHGSTRGKAKSRFLEICPDPWMASKEYWNEIRLRRVSDLDDKPLNWENYQSSNFNYTNDDYDEELTELDYVNMCNCPICKASK